MKTITFTANLKPRVGRIDCYPGGGSGDAAERAGAALLEPRKQAIRVEGVVAGQLQDLLALQEGLWTGNALGIQMILFFEQNKAFWCGLALCVFRNLCKHFDR